MKTRMTRITISLLILASQAITTFSAERYEEKKDKSHHKSTFHHHGHRSGFHKHKKHHQKPENPFGPGFHYCNSSHVNVGMGCQKPEGTCPEDPKSPNYIYRK